MTSVLSRNQRSSISFLLCGSHWKMKMQGSCLKKKLGISNDCCRVLNQMFISSSTSCTLSMTIAVLGQKEWRYFIVKNDTNVLWEMTNNLEWQRDKRNRNAKRAGAGSFQQWEPGWGSVDPSTMVEAGTQAEGPGRALKSATNPCNSSLAWFVIGLQFLVLFVRLWAPWRLRDPYETGWDCSLNFLRHRGRGAGSCLLRCPIWCGSRWGSVERTEGFCLEAATWRPWGRQAGAQICDSPTGRRQALLYPCFSERSFTSRNADSLVSRCYI